MFTVVNPGKNFFELRLGGKSKADWLKGNPKDIVNIFTLWLFNIAMENGPFIDGLPIKNCVFPWPC